MNATETIAQFYQRHGQTADPAGQCNVFRIEERDHQPSSYNRRDFYKILLLTAAEGVLHYADKAIAVHDQTLVFSNPLVSYSWERKAGQEAGFGCVFTASFLTPHFTTESLADSPLFRVDGQPVLLLPPPTAYLLRGLFEQMLAESTSTYPQKQDLLRAYIQIILHEARKLAPAESLPQPGTSAGRLAARFLDLLAHQFPLASPHQPLRLKTAGEFARQLAVHPNYLNQALTETTGKTTTAHVATKLLQEAKALLRHSDWPIADVGYGLGFEHAANFSIFFKKQTGQTPQQFRRQPPANS